MTLLILRAVPTLETAAIWPEAWEVIKPAFERGLLNKLYAPGDIQSRLADERMQLWTAEINGEVRCACLTEVHQFPRAKVLRVVAIGGEGFDLWPAWFTQLKKWARAIDCRFIVGDGRDGWARVMADSALKKTGTIYAMEITDG